MTIFVSIAAYRDPLLIPTIEDCLAKARYPDELRFGICWQHGEEERELPYLDDPRFRILDFDWRDSRGVCWARSEIQSVYDGEDFYLQLDSHHRFVKGWDAKLVGHAEATGSRKPVLSTYPHGWDHALSDEERDYSASRLDFDQWSGHTPILIRGRIPGWERLERPVRARFMAAGFFFTVGSFVSDIPYDPELFFTGEEITLAIRAFTRGYDLFHPPEGILWHKWDRQHRRTIWMDHVEGNVDTPWQARSDLSRAKIEQFLTSPSVGAFGCGSERTFEDYEAYAGMSFEGCRIQDYTRRNLEPPNPPCPAGWVDEVRTWRIRIRVERTALISAESTTSDSWMVSIDDPFGDRLHTQEFGGKELAAAMSSAGPAIPIELEFESSRDPDLWTVTPLGSGGEPLNRPHGHVGCDAQGGYAHVL